MQAYDADPRSFEQSAKPTMFAQTFDAAKPAANADCPCKDFSSGQMEIVKQLLNMSKELPTL